MIWKFRPRLRWLGDGRSGPTYTLPMTGQPIWGKDWSPHAGLLRASFLPPQRLPPLALLLAGAPSAAGPLNLSFGPPLSSFIFFLMVAIKVINGCAHKFFKSMGVPSLKEMSNEWNKTGVIFSSTDGLRRVGFMVDDAESARSGPPWTSSPMVFIRCCICILICAGSTYELL
jgi:hypothetical protein